MFASLFKKKSELPLSLPKHWPNPSDEDLDENKSRIICVGSSQKFHFNNNFVKTSKYEAYNFLPKFLLEEFNPRTKVANCYFLFISGFQTIPAISNTNGLPTTLMPLFCVVLIDGIFQALEDIARHKADEDANSSKTMKYNKVTKQFEQVKWSDVNVGDIIEIKTRETIPCDTLVLATAEKSEPAQGICYLETKSLDGETNLKIRNAMPITLNIIKDVSDVDKLFQNNKDSNEIICEHPNKMVDSFSGTINIDGLGKEAIEAKNVLLRGCVLRNTEWVIGIVVNTGHDTKILMSAAETKGKTSNLEVLASSEIKKIIFLLICVCVVGSTGQLIWNSSNNIRDIWYLHWDDTNSDFVAWIIKFFYFFLLHATFIPVSLYVSMAIIRSFQSKFMNEDLEMYYEKTDQPSLVRTMTLNEELGQISHIFSDKTGTLTCNVMDFRKASINGISYGQGITEIGKASWKLQGKDVPFDMLEGERKAKLNSVPHVTFYCPTYEKHMAENRAKKDKINEFFRVLAICHDVIPERIDGKIKLSASNPDDEAFVCASEYFGCQFCDRVDKSIILLHKDTNQEERVDLLDTIEFTSKRKRMSVIVRNSFGKIELLTKGADSAIIDDGRLHNGQDDLLAESKLHMDQYGNEGLRCLVVGYSILTEEIYETWSSKYRLACTDMEQINKKKKGLPNLIEDLEDEIERNLTLIGITAIEDRLQDGVPECIAKLVLAGIKFWMLTGDKDETATNIAVACNLVQPEEYMKLVKITKSLTPTKESILAVFKSELKNYFDKSSKDPMINGSKNIGLIIDGQSLATIMLDTQELRPLLLEFSQLCNAVVGCRVSPDQKRSMVNLIKVGVPGVRTLSIGDGANDVAMIQEAHVGVGIRGEEGLQAVNSSDFAIAQFRFLAPLLLKHGRYNYIRMTSLVCYMFYKNVMMSIAQFWFNFNCAFSGQKYYTEGAIQLFNLAFTSFPILLLGVYDMDIAPKYSLKYPQIYRTCIRNDYFHPSVFWRWILQAFIESTVLSVLPLYYLVDNYNQDDFWSAGATCFTAVVLVVNIKICFIQTNWYWLNYVIIVLSFVSWIVVAFIITNVLFIDYNWFHLFDKLTINPIFWLTILLLVTLITAKDLYVSSLERYFNFKPYHILQEIEVSKSSCKTANADKEVELRDLSVTAN